MEEEILKVMEEIDAYGGVVKAIEDGWLQMRLAESATRTQGARSTRGDTVMVGQNAFRREDQTERLWRGIPARSEGAARVLEKFEAIRDTSRQCGGPEESRRARGGGSERPENLMPYLIDCCHAYATVGEMVACLKTGWGEFQEPVRL